MEHHVTATECHLPYGITQCYLLPDTSERTCLLWDALSTVGYTCYARVSHSRQWSNYNLLFHL